MTLFAETSEGTTGELRFTVANGLDQDRSITFAIGEFSEWRHRLRWAHAQVLERGTLRASISGRVLTGSGALRAFHPISPVLCSQLTVNWSIGSAAPFTEAGTLTEPLGLG